jgi:hypothetical protein
MPARKRRLGLSDPHKTAAAAEVNALHASADRAEAVLDRLEDVRAETLDAAGPEAAPAPEPKPAKRGLWPFGGPKKSPAEARTAAILADLQGAAVDRPQASADLAAQRTPPAHAAGLPAPTEARALGK